VVHETVPSGVVPAVIVMGTVVPPFPAQMMGWPFTRKVA